VPPTVEAVVGKTVSTGKPGDVVIAHGAALGDIHAEDRLSGALDTDSQPVLIQTGCAYKALSSQLGSDFLKAVRDRAMCFVRLPGSQRSKGGWRRERLRCNALSILG